MTKELRFSAPVEVRAGEGSAVKVEGYAAIYNERARIGDYFEEVIAPGAFDGRLGDDITFLINHTDLPLARTTSGTLRLSLDDRGLKMSAELDGSDPDVARIVPKMKRGDLSKMSFAFEVEKDEWDESGDIPLRTIRKFKQLFDVAIVTNPAYGGTDIALRSLDAHREAEAPAPQDTSGVDGVTQALRLRLILTD